MFYFASLYKEANTVFFFCKLLPLIASWSQLIATYCSCFAEVIEYDFIECAGWSDWCVLPIICNSKHFNLFVFYFNVSNKISSTKPRLLKEANLFPLTVLISQKQSNMFSLNVLLYLTDVSCRSFAIQNISASLYSILTYQIKFPPPNPDY